MVKRLRQWLRGKRREEGAVAVEFGILLPVLLVLILGALDFGHMYYIKYTITNASREGARYAAKYTGITAPSSDAISTYVITGLNYGNMPLTNLVVNGDYSGAFPNRVITVTAQADKYWWVIDTLGFTNPTTVTGRTAMIVESP